MGNKLFLRATYEVQFTNSYSTLIEKKKAENYKLKKYIDNKVINFTIHKDGKTITAATEVDIGEINLFNKLESLNLAKISPKYREKILKIIEPFEESVRQLVGLIKQELLYDHIKDNLVKDISLEYSLDQVAWYLIKKESKLHLEGRFYHYVDVRTVKSIQKLLSEDEKPLIAVDYLHHAMQTTDRRYRWIFATTAAELAIKEILVRIEPKLKVILQKLPSPPVQYLYGDVLKSIAGIKYDKANIVRKGADIRNKLIHDPNSATPQIDDATKYVRDIEETIQWLLYQWRQIKRQKSEH